MRDTSSPGPHGPIGPVIHCSLLLACMLAWARAFVPELALVPELASVVVGGWDASIIYADIDSCVKQKSQPSKSSTCVSSKCFME